MTHPLRGKRPAAVVLSVAGFPDDTIFDALSVWVRTAFRKNLLAEIYRSAVESIVFSAKTEDIFSAVEQAGKELVMQKAVSPVMMQRIRQPIADPGVLAAVVNCNWQTMINEGLTPAEAGRLRHNPRLDSIEALLGMLTFGFDPSKAVNTKGILQFHFTGEKPGDYYLTIDE
jgi:hypothetical protein